ncbi:hypothetical protein CU669_10755 [Paramagnetospirillum kuznetsovii]|uniref:Uncharacterized protein n=1 Tax=Paramagnetospirillum kuznetsovii TaxID=2053833 RepID=A0A364NXK8_9PROT|nr:hypothetical protein [Paramagnetospirillum kuznetsovii]RAU21783.1 hypothetical protein CU669_10755 [Paramagnetospirillum kuznetsovii]
MVDTSRGISSSGQVGNVIGIREAVGRDGRPSRGTAVGPSGIQGATPNGPRGRRMLSPDTPLESLDRFAPRGTYLDILA